VTRYKEGRPYRVWVLPGGKRNEALDCRVYALAARMSLDPGKTRPSSHKREEITPATMQQPAVETPPISVVMNKKPAMARRQRTGFVNRW
jgi:phage terminase large subunit GpA-like protein